MGKAKAGVKTVSNSGAKVAKAVAEPKEEVVVANIVDTTAISTINPNTILADVTENEVAKLNREVAGLGSER